VAARPRPIRTRGVRVAQPQGVIAQRLKKRDDIPDATIKRLRALQSAVYSDFKKPKRKAGKRGHLPTAPLSRIDQRTKDDPDVAAAVDAELQAMRIE
jgi:hypothetical protein